MKKTSLFMLSLAAVFCAYGGSPDLSSRFELCCPLNEYPAKGAAGRLRIPGEVFDRSRSFPADLRILDETGTQWPFFIIMPSDRTQPEKQIPRILNKSFVAGPEPHWEFDLVLPGNDRRMVHNHH